MRLSSRFVTTLLAVIIATTCMAILAGSALIQAVAVEAVPISRTYAPGDDVLLAFEISKHTADGQFTLVPKIVDDDLNVVSVDDVFEDFDGTVSVPPGKRLAACLFRLKADMPAKTSMLRVTIEGTKVPIEFAIAAPTPK